MDMLSAAEANVTRKNTNERATQSSNIFFMTEFLLELWRPQPQFFETPNLRSTARKRPDRPMRGFEVA
jgi:hypothetical protein